MEFGQNSTRFRIRVALVAALVVGSGLAVYLPLGLAVVCWVSLPLSVFWIVRWKSALPLLAILLNPSVAAFIGGIASWSSPRPSVVGRGLPGAGFFNLNPETRCYRKTGGCVVNGSEGVVDIPRNLGLHLMLAIAGPPPRTYHGPYPSKDDASRLTDTAAESPATALPLGTIRLDDRDIELGTRFGENLMRDLGMIGSLDFEEETLSEHPVRVRCAAVESQCLVVRVDRQTPSRFSPASGPVDVIVLIDMASLKPFACYTVEGHFGRVPRILSPQFTASN